MALHKIPEFIAVQPKAEKERLMKLYINWKNNEITELMAQHYEKKLDKLLSEEEKESPVSWFQSKWSRVKRIGRREILRKILSDLKE